jgi:hypothetical protein
MMIKDVDSATRWRRHVYRMLQTGEKHGLGMGEKCCDSVLGAPRERPANTKGPMDSVSTQDAPDAVCACGGRYQMPGSLPAPGVRK